MKVTILEAGRAPGRLAEEYPRYPEMFASLLSEVDGRLTFETIALLDGAAPPDPTHCEAALITGSPFGVYDSTPWMDSLRAFVRSAFAAKTPLIGVCFGHQIIADAMGGLVRKSEKGWGVGRHTYQVVERRPWMTEAPSLISLNVSHQDQVIEPPKGAVTLARSDHTAHAMLAYDEAPVISLQGHPEFGASFCEALYSVRRGKSLSEAQADAAIASLKQPSDSALAGGWIARFLESVRR
jgi:GMP synthase-like glutamine amidotransferase